MADFIQFIPLYVRTEDDIRADMDTDANAGLDPTDSDWVDTRPVSFFHMVTQPFVIEAARIHDYVSTLPAVAFIEFAYGEYLDYHAADFNEERKAAVAATGRALFAGSVGTEVSLGTQISTEQVDANVPPIVFLTTETATINGPLAAPTGLSAVVAVGGGSLAAGDRYYVVTAADAAGETLESAELHVHITTSGSKATISWTAVANASSYWVYEGGTGAEAQAVEVTAPGLLDDGSPPWAARVPPSVNGTGGKVLIGIRADDQSIGQIGNVAPDSLKQILTYNQGLASVTNPVATDGGLDVESDPVLQSRLMTLRSGEGPGNVTDYKRWSLDEIDVPRVQVIPLYNGPGTVGLVIMNFDGSALPATTQAQVQADLDPYPAQGGGIAPIDHQVYVLLPTEDVVNVTATITFATGFSYDGTGNTVALRAVIEDAIANYFTGLNCGDTVQVDRIKAVIYAIDGVATVTLTAPSGDVTTTIVPPAPTRGALGTVTLL